jgi:hypothetical protein
MRPCRSESPCHFQPDDYCYTRIGCICLFASDLSHSSHGLRQRNEAFGFGFLVKDLRAQSSRDFKLIPYQVQLESSFVLFSNGMPSVA